MSLLLTAMRTSTTIMPTECHSGLDLWRDCLRPLLSSCGNYRPSLCHEVIYIFIVSIKRCYFLRGVDNLRILYVWS